MALMPVGAVGIPLRRVALRVKGGALYFFGDLDEASP